FFFESPSFLDGPYDTMPEHVREITYKPSLAAYPLPEGVIDELRSPYREKKDKFLQAIRDKIKAEKEAPRQRKEANLRQSDRKRKKKKIVGVETASAPS